MCAPGASRALHRIKYVTKWRQRRWAHKNGNRNCLQCFLKSCHSLFFPNPIGMLFITSVGSRNRLPPLPNCW